MRYMYIMSLYKPVLYSIKQGLYYLAEDLKSFSPNFFYGTSKTIRNIIERKKIPIDDILYVNKSSKVVENEWKICNVSCKKAKLMISKRWVDSSSLHFLLEPPCIVSDTVSDVVENIPTNSTLIENPNINNDSFIQPLPPILELEDREKFKDVDGKVIDIEVRGQRNEEHIYFKVKDVSKGFDMPNLREVLLHVDKGYVRNVDYKTFNKKNIVTNGQCFIPIKEDIPIKKEHTTLYLTYQGMLRMLFVSRNKNTQLFRKWATKILYTTQMGTGEQKEVLGTNILNVSLESYRAVFKSYANKLPSIYLLSLGKVKNLRETFNISQDVDENSIVYKFGFTDDLERRFAEHHAKYGKLPGVQVLISCFNMIDVKYTSEAEGELRQFFKNFKKNLLSDGYRELVILDSEEHKSVVRQYKYIGNEFSGFSFELQEKIKELEKKIIELQAELQYKLLQKDMTILEKNSIIQEKDSQIKYKDLEMDYLKLQLKFSQSVCDKS